MQGDRHPFLSHLEYFFQTEVRLYFIMPFIKGGDLYRLLKIKKRLAENAVRFFITQIVLAVGKLHDLNIMHRDMKLENIMIEENGYLKLIDYGLAKFLEQGDVATTKAGTVEYFAPEMISTSKKRGYDKQADWWAVGIIAFELLTGVTPYHH